MNELANERGDRLEGSLPHHERIKEEIQGVQFNIPVFSHIDGNLWMGGSPTHTSDFMRFKYIVNVYRMSYVPAAHQMLLLHPLLDDVALPNLSALDHIVDMTIDFMARGPTLVHCQAGINRSGLVCALALMKRRGWPAEETLALLRKQRADVVLCNKAFEEHVLAVGR